MCLASLLIGGCEGPSSGDGTNITTILLPTDTTLNFACADVGIAFEQCVLEDPENPYVLTPITEFFNSDNPGNKFELFEDIPRGPTGAKARFYLWATALAKSPRGENQYYTALALHELWNYNPDPLLQEQALRAYRSVLDNFFGQFTVFDCCGDQRPPGEGDDPIQFPATLNELTADNLYRTAATAPTCAPSGCSRLVPGVPLLVEELLLEWGYEYRPATPPNFDDGLIIPINPPGF